MIRYCPHCWREVPFDADRCPACGEPLDDNGQPFVDRLLATLRHPEPTRAGLAIDLLAGRLHEPRAVQPMVELLGRTRDAAILVQAARGLGELGDRQAIPALVRLLGDPERPYVARRAAALALGRLGGSVATRALQAAVDDPRPSVAAAAREALQNLVTKRVTDE